MNFKLILIISIITISCGLKTKPKAPQGTSLPSVQSDYTTKVEINKKKKSENSNKNKKKK